MYSLIQVHITLNDQKMYKVIVSEKKQMIVKEIYPLAALASQ